MFTVNYCDFVECVFYSYFSVSYMPGIKVSDMKHAKVAVNVDTESAYVYSK